MFSGQEEYFQELLALVKEEISLYTKYAVRMREDGRIRHVYNTKLFQEELSNVLEDAFSHMDRNAYDRDRKVLFARWREFHDKACRTVKSGVMLPFEYMLRKLELTEFEQFMACLAIAPELNREFERLYCYLQDDLAWRYPSLDLCVKMYTMEELEQNAMIHQVFARKEMLCCIFGGKGASQESELAWRLKLSQDLIDFVFFYESDLLNRKAEYQLRVSGGETEAGLNINQPAADAIRRQLAGNSMREQQKLGAVSQSLAGDGKGQSQAEDVAGQPLAEWQKGKLFLLRGPCGSGKKLQIRKAAGALGYNVLFFDLREVSDRSEEQIREAAGQAAVRAVLDRAFLAFCHWEALWAGEKKKRRAAQAALRRASLFFQNIFLTVEEEPGKDALEGEYPFGYQVEEFRMRFPTIQERSRLWQEFLAENIGKHGKPLNEQKPRQDSGPEDAGETAASLYDRLAAQFDFTPGVIREAAAYACRQAKDQGQAQVPDVLFYQACQQKISHRLGERASRVRAAYAWDDLVLEDGPKELLRQACSQVAYRGKVYEQWGFQDKIAYGRGVSLLFAGPPGTGKTMAAQVLARELNLELYKVDLSGVLSKYIGETQKNLREIFDEVKKSRSILFFDEADVLFGKRVDVSDARDISANAQTAYLLQKMEEYDGITILATNLMQNFDDAYKRRMKYIIRFTFPQKEQRAQLWEKVFPGQMPLKKDIDIPYLSENFELSGASIKNIAINAAFIAASRQEITGMEHIMTALQQEYEKSGKILGKAELKEYYGYKIPV
ncbi:MAG: ATP-binding protein [Lachnospiraceae bacterium]|nr:ATP-binding protein [Lachnospiraceae bacterium]